MIFGYLGFCVGCGRSIHCNTKYNNSNTYNNDNEQKSANNNNNNNKPNNHSRTPAMQMACVDLSSCLFVNFLVLAL